MVIQNSAHTYVAVQKLESERIRQYLCRRIAPGEDGECRMAVVPNEYAPELIPYLKGQRDKGTFTDLLDFFTDDGNLYIVTAARPVPGLTARLKGNGCSVAERMTIMKNLLSRLILQGMDDFFCCAALEPSAIGVSDSLEIALRYDMDGITDHEQYVFVMTQYRLSLVAETLFEEELRQESLPEMAEFSKRLKQGTFSDLLEIYKWFLPTAEVWISGAKKELKSMGFWFRMWERIKFLAGKLVGLWKVLLLLLAAGYLVLSVKSLYARPAMSENFKQIGTLTIERQGMDKKP